MCIEHHTPLERKIILAIYGKHLGIDTENCVIYSLNKLIATIGISDLVIVENDKALLVCSLERAQEVKALVEKIEVEGLEEFLIVISPLSNGSQKK